MRSGWAMAAVGVAGLGCSGLAAGPAAERPFTGAPVALVAREVKGPELRVDAVSFADEPIVGYDAILRYHGADGRVLKLQVGTPFEGEVDRLSFSGMSYTTNPGDRASFSIEPMAVPRGAASVDVLATRVTGASGKVLWEMRDPPLWSDPWPEPGGPDVERFSAVAGDPWHGAFVLSPWPFGGRAREAGSVDGTTVHTFDGAEERVATLVRTLPCAMRVVYETPGGGTEARPLPFTVVDGKLVADGHAQGLVVGDDALVCLGMNDAITRVGGECRGWTYHGGWTSKPETCAFEDVDGQRIFRVGGAEGYVVHGAALVDQYTELPAVEPAADFAAARLALGS